MSEVLGQFKGYPIIRIDRMDAIKSYINDCPGCGSQHEHGSEHDLSYHQLSHRGAHCHGDGYEGYWLVADEETEGWQPQDGGQSR